MNLSGQSIFFLGIGGMGMLPLALFVREGGAKVEGFDDGLTARAEALLRRAGIGVYEYLPPPGGFDLVVISSAIRDDHPVLKQLTKDQKDPPRVVRRGELLAEIASTRRLVAVVGSHGKTSTTALLSHLADAHSKAADFVIGGLPEGELPPARNRGAEWLIAEVDESDGTIEKFSPEITVFLNFDWDHADRYRDPAAIRDAWRRLAGRTTRLVIRPRSVTQQAEPDWSDLRAEKVFDNSSADFNVRNESAAQIAFEEMFAVPLEPEAFLSFSGVWRRQTFHLRGADFAVIEDYAHHPEEVAALLRWLAGQDLPEPVTLFFQPHRFTRTTRFVNEFVEVLSGLKSVFLHSIYGAGERASLSVDPLESIREGLSARGVQVNRVDRLEDFPPRQGTFVFVGAGDANKWAPVMAALHRNESRVGALAEVARRAVTEGELCEGEVLGSHTTLRIGGKAALWVAPGTVAELRSVVRTAHLLNVPVEFIGNGSNLLVCDEGFEGMVVHLAGKLWERKELSADGQTVRIGPAVSMPGLARWAAGEGLDGFSFLEGIPGSVGGGVRMNAGSMGGWMENLVREIETIDATGHRTIFRREELSFGYRSCPELEGLCIIGIVLEGTGNEKPEKIRKTMREYGARRRSSQPGGPSAGCLFRNPEGDSAGRLIDAAGLKEFGIGQVRISGKHANFIQPEAGATAADVVGVMAHARKTVFERFGILLEPEVKWLGRHGMSSLPLENYPRAVGSVE